MVFSKFFINFALRNKKTGDKDMKITEEKINKNYVLWTECLKKYNCYSEELINDYGDKIRKAAFAMNDNSGGAYAGALLDIVLSRLCVIATHINENAFGENDKGKTSNPYLKCDKQSLMKVLLLQHISKADLFYPVSDEWKLKRGYFYDFNNDLETALKLGERSIFMCQKYGITLTEQEYDAMRVLDKENDMLNSFMTPLAELVKIANQLTAMEIAQNYKQNI